MKKIFLSLGAVFFALRIYAGGLVPYTETVGFTAIATTSGYYCTGNLTVYEESTTAPSSRTPYPSGGESPLALARMKPGKQYVATFQGTAAAIPYYPYNTSVRLSYKANLVAPAGYDLYINGVATEIIDVTKTVAQGSISVNDSYALELRPTTGSTPVEAGSFGGIALGNSITWDVGLGGVRSGQGAGRIIFKEKDLANSPTSRDRLYYTAPASNGQIAVVKDGASNQTLRQISTPQVVVDLVDDSSGGYWFKFYTPSQATWSSTLYTFTGNPWRTIRVEAPNGDASKLQITQTEGSVNRISNLELTSGSVSSGTYTWTLRDGGYYVRGAVQWLRTTTLTSTNYGGTPASRDVVVAIYNGGDVLSAKTKYHYVTQPWGDEVVANIITDPDGVAQTTTCDYYTDTTQLGNYRKLKSVTEPTGNWTSYLYYDDWNRRGQLKVESHPYINSPATVQPADPSVGYSIAYDYTADYTGLYHNESSRVCTINSVKVGQRTTTATVSSASTSYQADDYASTSLSQQSTIQINNPVAGGYPEFYKQPTLIQRPDQSRDVYAYDFCIMSSGYYFVAPNGNYFKTSVFRGSSNSAGAESYTPTGASTVYLVPNKSTMDVTIRNPAGLIVRKETHVYTGGGAFTRLSTEDISYDVAGRLTDSNPSNGAAIHNDYYFTQPYGMLLNKIDESGVETDFTFDVLGRVSYSIKKGVSGGSYAAQADITTQYSYDGSSRITQTQVSGGSLSLTSTASYDLSGRILTQVKYSGSTSPVATGYSYSAGGKIASVNLPNGGDRTTENYLDGQPYRVTGNAAVNEFFSYSVSGSGNRLTQHRLVSETSPTAPITTTTSDWLGRTISFVRPAWGGATATQTWLYNNSGQLYKSSQTGAADTLYFYDSLGQLYRTGLDVDSNGSLEPASSDRIKESVDSFYDAGGGDWFLRTQASTYTTLNSATSTLVSDQYVRVTNFSGALRAETRVKDQYGNLATNVLNVDRANKTATSDTTVVGSTNHEVKISYNGLPVSAKDSANITMAYGYDDLGRLHQSTDPRTGTMTTDYVAGTSLVYSLTDPANIAQATYGYDSAGRPIAITNGLGKTSRCDYNYRDQKLHNWGAAATPIEYIYNDYGQQKMLKTFANATADFSGTDWPTNNLGTPAITRWKYDEPTSLLQAKYDAANVDANGDPLSGANCVSFSYTQAGQVVTRTGQRGLTTTYSYSPSTGELTGTSYSDGTPALVYHYNRFGGADTVTDVTGTHTFNYNPTGTLELQSEDLPANFFGSRRLTYNYDFNSGSITLGRSLGFSLGTSATPAIDQNVVYNYQADGRLWTIAAGGQTFTYGYQTNSHLIKTVTCGSYTDTRDYDAQLDKATSRQTTWATANKAKFDYAPTDSPLDAIGQIKAVVKTGELFSIYGDGTEGLKTTYSYDDRSELKSEQTTVGSSSTVLPGRDNGTATSPGFFYDKQGNRTTTIHNGNTTNYNPNSLDQYTTFTAPGIFDVAGAAATSATVTVNSSSGGVSRSGNYFFEPFALDNSTSSAYSILTLSDGSTSGYLNAFLPARSHIPVYDLDGNLTDDGRWTLSYDAENRLVSCVTSAANVPQQKLLFTYDYLNRRVQKRVYNWDAGSGSWNPISDTRFIYQGWNLVAELNGFANNTVIRTYVWGIDLSGSVQGAGGVGGLLSLSQIYNTQIQNTCFPVYDAMGNIHGLLDTNGTLVAAYEYDSFGQTLRESGGFAAINPFRYSSKYTDLETGFVYYGKRYYNPSFGRFINRDPIEELGGVNLYGFCGNNSINRWDYLGHSADTYANYHGEEPWRNNWLSVAKASEGGDYFFALQAIFASHPDATMDALDRATGTGYYAVANQAPTATGSSDSGSSNTGSSSKEKGSSVTALPFQGTDGLVYGTSSTTWYADGTSTTVSWSFNFPVSVQTSEIAIAIGTWRDGSINFLGHAAAAIAGRGTYSFGTDTPFKSSFTDYLKIQSTYRNTTIYLLRVSLDQANAMVDKLDSLTQIPMPDAQAHPSDGYEDNCAVRLNQGLSAAGFSLGDIRTPAGLQRALEKLVESGAATVAPIPKNPQYMPPFLSIFNPQK